MRKLISLMIIFTMITLSFSTSNTSFAASPQTISSTKEIFGVWAQSADVTGSVYEITSNGLQIWSRAYGTFKLEKNGACLPITLSKDKKSIVAKGFIGYDNESINYQFEKIGKGKFQVRVYNVSIIKPISLKKYPSLASYEAAMKASKTIQLDVSLDIEGRVQHDLSINAQKIINFKTPLQGLYRSDSGSTIEFKAPVTKPINRKLSYVSYPIVINGVEYPRARDLMIDPIQKSPSDPITVTVTDSCTTTTGYTEFRYQLNTRDSFQILEATESTFSTDFDLVGEVFYLVK